MNILEDGDPNDVLADTVDHTMRQFPNNWHPLKKKAMAKFVDVKNLDLFLQRVM
jgi:hypothetical protein